MYRELLSDGCYDNATEYGILFECAREEYEEELEREKYERECMIEANKEQTE